MSCENVQALISSLIDRQIDVAQREEALAHVEACRRCSSDYEALRRNRAAMRTVGAQPVPVLLRQRLDVLASHERTRQLERVTWRARTAHWREMAQLKFDNLMRPVALPVAGGLVTALLMFGALIPSVSSGRSLGFEPPTQVYTEPDGQVVGEGDRPKLDSASDPGARGKIVVVLTVDEHGRVKDYSVTQGKMTPEVQNFILFSIFTPATMFGKPTVGQVKAVFGADMRS